MAKEIEDQLPVKPVGLFSEVIVHRTGKEVTEEKKYEIKDDGNFNFTGEHQLDDTEDINSTNINDSDGRSISQNQIRMVGNIKINIQHAHGPTTIKLPHCFRLPVYFTSSNTDWLDYYPTL